MKRFAASYIYTLKDAEPLRDAFIEIDESGRIVNIGQIEDSTREENFLEGVAIVPGFVNTHCHIELSYLKGLFSKGSGMAGFIDQINAMRDNTSKQQKIDSIRSWMDTLFKRGVVAMADISNCDDSFAIKAASPIYTRTFLEVFGTEPQDCTAVMDSVAELEKRALESGIDAAPTPHSCYTTSPELLTAASKAALKSGFLSYHSEESEQEEEMLISGSGEMFENRKTAGMSTPPITGQSSLRYFIQRLLAAHPAPFEENILLVHEVCLNEDGVCAVKEVMKNPFIALCPRSNIYIHNQLPPLPLMVESGIKLTIGTDSLSSNDDLDMVSELLCLQENFDFLTLGQMLSWACKNGAEFLGKADILGTLEVGKAPGLVAVTAITNSCRLSSASRSYRLDY